MKNKAFTLIELLIVVAIIAILAAIAVPNFLEAQVRAKVSRAKSDQRSIATAIEAYAVDNNKPIVAYNQYVMTGANAGKCGTAPAGGSTKMYAMSHLTTPVGYITSIPPDPFREKGLVRKNSPEYNYNSFDYDAFFCPYQPAPASTAFAAGYSWVLTSVGPSKQANGAGVANILLGSTSWVTDPTMVVSGYDPSNGTISKGFIMRSNKGVFTTAGS